VARGSPGDGEDQNDDNDCCRLEQNASAHPHLRLFARHILSRRHRNHAAHEDVNDPGHRKKEKDEQKDAHPRALSSHENETKGKLAHREVHPKIAAIDPALSHCGKRWSEISLRKSPAICVGDKRMVEINGLLKVEKLLKKPLDGR
jgi:hypothetical protein